MARTIDEIYDEIVAEKESLSSLNGLQPATDNAVNLLSNLSNTSSVAIWRLLAYIVAVAIWSHEKLWDVFKSEVDAIVDAGIPGTAKWYQQQCLLYQNGDTMEYANYKYSYPSIDESLQIVKRASAQELGGNVLLKVAKEVDGVPERLSASEISGFTSYINKIKFAGTFCTIISSDADLLSVSMNVYYDPSIINSSGELIKDTSIKPVEDALETYIASLPWNGVIKISAIMDAVQGVAGVDDIVIDTVQAKASAATNWIEVEKDYTTVSGYVTISNYNITYVSI